MGFPSTQMGASICLQQILSKGAGVKAGFLHSITFFRCSVCLNVICLTACLLLLLKQMDLCNMKKDSMGRVLSCALGRHFWGFLDFDNYLQVFSEDASGVFRLGNLH